MKINDIHVKPLEKILVFDDAKLMKLREELALLRYEYWKEKKRVIKCIPIPNEKSEKDKLR